MSDPQDHPETDCPSHPGDPAPEPDRDEELARMEWDMNHDPEQFDPL